MDASDVTERLHTGRMSTKSDVIMLTLASRSAGVVTRSDLLESGVSSSTIGQRVKRGFLMTVWAGLYEVPELTNKTTPLFRAVKSVPDSAISGVSAGRVYGAPLPSPDGDEPVHIIASYRGPRTTMPGVVLHRTRRPIVEDIRYPVPGLPTLSPARTMLDLAGVTSITDRRLAHIVETQLTARLLDPDEVMTMLERPGLRGVAGAARLRAIVESEIDDEPIADSMLERRFAKFLVEHEIAPLRRLVRPPWFDGRRGIVDFADPELRLIVEVDGRRWHSTTQAHTDDRRRDRRAAAVGWQVLGVTWSDIIDEPTMTAEHLAATIAARRRSPDQAKTG